MLMRDIGMESKGNESVTQIQESLKFSDKSKYTVKFRILKYCGGGVPNTYFFYIKVKQKYD